MTKPSHDQITTIQAAYRAVCQERGHTVTDVLLNESMPDTDAAMRRELSTTAWLADRAALDAANGKTDHVVYALTADNLPF